MAENKMNVETTEREIIFTRSFDAPRELVFSAFSSCEHLKHWWGPRAWPMAECSLDFREGGVWHYCLRGPNQGDEAWGRAEFKRIVEPERIVYIDSFSDAEGNINSDMPEGLTTFEFAEENGATQVTGRTEYSSASELEKVLDMGVIEGMTETIDRLEEYLARVVEGG